MLAVFVLVALLLNSPLLGIVPLIALIALLVLPFQLPELPVPAPVEREPLPLVEDVTRQLSTSLSIGQVASIVLSAALRATDAEVATLALPVEVDHLTLIQLRRGQERVQMDHRAPSGDTLAEQVLQQGRTIFSRDHFSVGVVLRHEYLVVGALCVQNEEHILTRGDADLLNEIAAPAAISLHNAQLLDEQQHQIDMLSHIETLTTRLAGAVERDLVAQAVLETTRDILGVQEVAIYRVENGQPEIVLSLHRDRFSRAVSEPRLTQTVAQKTAEEGKIQIVRQPVVCVGVPVEYNGIINEVLAVAFIEPHTLRRSDLNALSLLASQTAAYFDTVELHEQVRAVSERLHVTINSARDGVLLLDAEGRLIECNPSAERLLGIDKETFMGKHFVAMLFGMMKGADDLNGLGYSRSQLTELARQLRLEPNRITRRQFEQISNGQKLTIEEIGSPVVDSNKRIVGRLLVLRDMTEQKLLSDFRDEITNMAVHDLRGPLTAIINGIDMTLKTGLDEYPEDNERILRLSLDSARSLMRVINSLLDIAKLESRRIPINPQPTSAATLVDAACKTVENSLQEAQIQLEVILDHDLPPVNVDPELMRRVLVNLLDNALRFTPQGGTVRIDSGRPENNHLTLSVIDSGPGIPPEERDLVFEQYRQSNKNKALRGSQGTGLGLTFCKLAVEAHGGRIWVSAADSLPGACFNISLPVAT
ncbi:MAG TPA: ATP-binding protein [Phototrophicaceae bacterium]|nr:ATP-binding protein [Phototrophicaceae bacterium]